MGKVCVKITLGVAAAFLMACLSACGGGSGYAGGSGGSGGSGSSGGSGGSGSSGGSGGSGGGGGNTQPRPFPDDFFFRLPNQDGGAWSPFEVYDPALKELFVSNPDLNTVEVYSTVDGHYVGHISVPGPAGLSFSPDNSKLVIGTITPYIYFADPSALRIVSQIVVPVSVLTSAADGTTLMPVMPYVMADGSIFLGMGANPESWNEPYTSVLHLVRYDPANGMFTATDPGIGEVTGAPPAASLDRKSLLVEGLTTTTLELFLYSTDAQGYVATSGPLLNEGYYFAANADGSQFASVPTVPNTGVVTLWSSNLQQINQYTLTQPAIGGALYSRDSKYLYFMTQTGSVTVLDTQTAIPAGYVGISIGGVSPWGFFDVDENYHLFGIAQPGGALILNASQPQAAASPVMPNFSGNAAAEANPNVGPIAAGTQVQFIPAPAESGGSADGISSSMEAYFGLTPATQDTVAPYSASSNGGNFLTATTPAPAGQGPVSVILTDANNDVVFLPDAYTYGPHLLRSLPNAASSQGGDVITIYAYGLGFSLSGIQVTVGGNPVNMKHATLNPNASVYPEQSLTFPVPQGTPGWADIVLTTPNGTDTLKRGLQYLNVEANVPDGPFTFAVYDSTREHFYLTGAGNTVGVFDAGTQAFLQPLQPPAAVSSGSSLQGEALTPDASKLLVADPSDQIVVIFDLVANTSTTVSVSQSSDPPNVGQPMFVATASENRAFVSMVPCIPNSVREINLENLTVQVRADAGSSCSDYVPYPRNGVSSSDGSTIVYAGSSGSEFGVSPSGPEYVWRYDAASDAFTGPVMIQDMPWVGGQASVNSDGTVIAVGQGIVDQRLLPLVPAGQNGPNSWALNGPGSLVYSAYSEITLSDTHNERQLLTLGLPIGLPYLNFPGYGTRPLAVDSTGQKVLALTQNGVSYFELSVVPLAVGTVAPSQVSAGGMITVSGSGFVAGTTVQIGGQMASCAETNSQTLSCTVPNVSSGAVPITLMNPDGQIYSFENALAVQ